MQSIPLISIITPVYNGAEYLDDLIVSVRDQNYPSMEHIIIDDGSNDNGMTVAVLKKYSHLRWWSHENRGQYATMNEGLDAAKGEVVCFVSADDILLTDAISKAITHLRAHQNEQAVYGLASLINEDGSPYPVEPPFRRASFRYYPYFSQVSHCSLYIYKKTLLERKLQFREDLSFVGDYDWLIRILKSGIEVGVINAPLSKIRIHALQTSTKYQPAMLSEQKKVYLEHGISQLSFRFFTFFYVISHNTNKLRHAFLSAGWTGARKLAASWFEKRFSGKHT
jgi:glycosyltransferase involved in cell wall biosynthesis